MTTERITAPPTLTDIRFKMFELARRTGIKPLKAGEQMFLSPQQATELGVDIDEGWLLKIIGAEGEAEPTLSLITPEKWEIIGEGLYVSPEGKQFTEEELTELYEQQQVAVDELDYLAGLPSAKPDYLAGLPSALPPMVKPEIGGMLRRLYPELFTGYVEATPEQREQEPFMAIETLVAQANKNPEEFFQSIYDKGMNPDTKALLGLLIPEITSADITDFFAKPDPYAPLKQRIRYIFPQYAEDVEGFLDWAAENTEIFLEDIRTIGLTKDTWNLMRMLYPDIPKNELTDFFAFQPQKPVGEDFLGAIQTGLQYIEGWWQTGLMETGFEFYRGLQLMAGEDELWYSEAEKILNEAYKKYGWKAIFSREINEAWEVYFAERGSPSWLGIVAEMTNPLFLIPAGGVAIKIAKPFLKVPVLGEVMQGAAKTVVVGERAIIEATLLPTTFRVGKKAVAKIYQALKPERYLINSLPSREILRQWLFKNDYFRQIAERIPMLRKLAPMSVVKAELPKILTTHAEIEAVIIQEVGMRTATLSVGQSTKGQAMAYLRELGSTKKFLGVRDAMCNPKLVRPKFEGESLALGDVVQAPERYFFADKNAFNYCKRAQKLCSEMYELASKEGLEIKKLELEPFEEYVHWVVTGKVDKNGVVEMARRGSRSVGGIPSAMKHRRFEKMIDGLNEGYVYADDLETYVGSYIDDLFKGIADKRFGVGISEAVFRLSKEFGALPVLPTDRLMALYPEQAKAWWMRGIRVRAGEIPTIREAVADLGYVMSGVKQIQSGIALKGATLKAIEQRTPELASRIRGVINFKGDRATTRKLEDLIWTRMQAGKTIPATLPTERAAVKEYVATLNKEQVKTIYQQYAKLEGADGLMATLRGELEKMMPEWYKARFARQQAMEIVRRPILGRGEGYISTVTGLPHPMFQNQIYPKAIAEQASKLLNDEGWKWMRITAQISGAFRLQIAALDISAGVIQGFVAMFAHPVVAGKAQIKAIETLIFPNVLNRFMVRHSQAIAQRNWYLGEQRAFSFFEQMPLLQKIWGKIPFIGKPILGQTYGRTEAAFSMWSTYYKTTMWEVQSAKWIKAGQGREFARYLDRITGMMSFNQLGMPANTRNFLKGWVFFAPEYRVSVLSYFADAFKGGMTGTMVRTDIAKMVSAATIMYVAFCKATDNPIYLDPYKDGKKFMSINIDEHWVGLGSAVVSLIRAFVDITASLIGAGENEPMDLLTAEKWKNPIIRAFVGQSAVLPQILTELITRRDYLGYPLGNPIDDPDAWVNWAKWAGEQVTPIWLQDILFDKSGVGWTPISALAEFVGLRTSPQTRWETMDDKLRAEKVWEAVSDLSDEQRQAIEDGGHILSVLAKHQKYEVWDAYPELISFYEEAQADALLRASPMVQDYTRGMKQAQDELVANLNKALNIGVLVDGENTRYLRKRYEKNVGDYGIVVDAIRTDDRFQPLIQEWEEAREERKLEAELIDLAYWDYIEKVVAPDRETDAGDFDFEEYQEALAEWREYWGEEIYEKILYIIEHNKKAIEDYPEWAIKLWQDKLSITNAGYWDLPIKPIYQFDEKDKADELVPEEYLSLWEQYNRLTTDEQREVFKEAHPDFARDWRAEFRAASPEQDAMLALWGYGGKLQTKEAYDLATKWAGELGIPLEQVGLGLPPQHLINPYFEHLKLVSLTSGSSPDVKLFKLKNPEYLSFGVTQYGWDDLKGEVIEALQIRVDFKEQIAEYKSFGDEKSEAFIEDDAERREKREQYYASNPNFRDGMRRLEVFETGIKDLAVIDANVEYGKLVDKYSSASAEAKLWRYHNEALETWGTSTELRGTDAWKALEIEKVPIWEIDKQYRKEDNAYQAILDKYTDAKEQSVAIAQFLAKNEEYAKARRVREGYGMGWTDTTLIDNYVEYMSLPTKGFWQERYLKANQGLYDALKEQDRFKLDFAEVKWDEIPVQLYDELYDRWQPLFSEYETLKTDEQRDNYLLSHPDFARDRYKRLGLGKLFPEKLIDDYADYYVLLFKGKPIPDVEWYEDDWFIQEHPDFHQTMVDMGIWKKLKDLSKVPTREVYKLYEVYQLLPKGLPRYAYRANHRDLDAWLFLKGKVSKTIEEYIEDIGKGRWEKWAEEAAELLNEIQRIAQSRKERATKELEELKRKVEELMKK